MAQFGGNEFTTFSVPLVFEGRYFVLEPGNPPLLTVFSEKDGKPVFEVLKNQPVENALARVSTNPTGVVTITDKISGKFLYKIRPESEPSVVFGKLDGGEVPCRIADGSIQVGGAKVTSNVFDGQMAGVVVRFDGSIGVGAPIPLAVRHWLSGR
jgi:hypothetical protein